MIFKRIGKLQFALVGKYEHKDEARSEAQSIRDGGYNARVVRDTKTQLWQVWREVV